MTEQEPTVVTEITTEKKPFYKNPKIIAGVVAGAVATGVAFVVHGSKSGSFDEDDDTTVETFKS